MVEVTGLDDRTGLTGPVLHTYQLKVTERYDLVSENVIMYSATMEDSEIFERPWTINMPIYRRLEEGYELSIQVCGIRRRIDVRAVSKGWRVRAAAASGNAGRSSGELILTRFLAKCPAWI